MQILAMHEEHNVWYCPYSVFLVGWGMKGTHCGSQLLRFPEFKKIQMFWGFQIFPLQRAQTIQHL